MADTNTTPPRYTTTPTDATYAPLSGLAVGAAATGGLFLFLFVLIGLLAFTNGKPMQDAEIVGLLFLAFIGVVLAFVARRSIRASEGTRTGEKYANAGWWMCVVGGLILIANFFAVRFVVQTEVDKQFKQFGTSLQEAGEQPTTADGKPDYTPVNKAFLMLMPPGERAGVKPEDEETIGKRFRDPIEVFRRNRLLLIAQRNKGQNQITSEGIVTLEWEQQGEIVKVGVGLLMTNPEGEFRATVPFVGKAEGKGGKGGRQWNIDTNYVNQLQTDSGILALRTRYGWLVDKAARSSMESTNLFLQLASNNQDRQPSLDEGTFRPPLNGIGQGLAYAVYAEQRMSPADAEKASLSSLQRAGLLGGIGQFFPGSPEYVDRITTGDFFARANGDPTDPAHRSKFLYCWQTLPSGGIVMASQIMFLSTDTYPSMRTDGGGLEVRVPVELKTEKCTVPGKAARGRLVLKCIDTEYLAELNAAREAASKPTDKSPTPPLDLKDRKIKWQVVRFESDLVEVEPQEMLTPNKDGLPGG